MTHIKIPSKAVADEDDILNPLTKLLRGLHLWDKDEETNRAATFASTFTGPPQSVALIEAGATATAKWWASGLGAAVIAVWTTVGIWWGGQDLAVRVTVILAAAIVTAAAVLGIAHLLSSDVRGRADAAVAIIQARAQLATTLVQAAEEAHTAPLPEQHEELVALPAPLEVSYITKPRSEEQGWYAVALLSNGKNVTKYLVVKGSDNEWVNAAEVELVALDQRSLFMTLHP